MRRPVSALALALLCLGSTVREAAACTTFCLSQGKGQSQELVFGKNYDWSIGDGLLVVNRRGVAKTALLEPEERPASWVSRYGSVTFNQYGRELPNGGMNEAGLVVEVMWLDETVWPARDDRPALGALEWVQYQLDRFEKTADVVRAAAGMRVISDAQIHWLVCDASGDCATIEFLDGKLVAHHGKDLPVPALTNHTYRASLENLQRKRAEGQVPQGRGSLERFARAADLLRADRGAGRPAVRRAFEILDSVAQGSYTQWNIVYDMRAKRVHFKTRTNPAVRWFDLRAFDFVCGAPARILDVDRGRGDLTRQFAPYRVEDNRRLVERAFRGTDFLRGTPPEFLERVIQHPQTTSCRP
ncbi:MAG TPA: linear amide C-N hydrolase [Thermoanaerobaculia bacterium]|nr:linear amide C-N hydrolase [Thermoanaerobaculia bacterium]